MEFMNHPIFRASNRYHVPTKEMTQDLYKLYELLRDLNLSLRSKQMSFETAADCSDSWQIVCISYDAAKVIDSTESAKGLRRAHPISRKQRAERMFSEGKMAKGELIRYFFENDTVVLVTSEENNMDGYDHWSKLSPVPEGILTGGSFSVYARKRDVDWVRGIIRKR